MSHAGIPPVIRSVTPNPSSGSVSITYRTSTRGELSLHLCHPSGAIRMRLADGHHEPGEYTAFASGLAPGRYFCVLTAVAGSVSADFDVTGQVAPGAAWRFPASPPKHIL